MSTHLLHFLTVDTSVTTLIIDARYSGRYSSSCEPKHTLLLFKGFYWVIWSHGQGEQSLIYRNVLDGGQHAPLPRAVLSPPLYFLLPFVLICFSSPALTSRLLLLCLSAGFPAPIGTLLLSSRVTLRGWCSLDVSSQTAESAS